MTTLTEPRAYEIHVPALADSVSAAAERLNELSKRIADDTNRLGRAMQGSGLEPDLAGAADYIDRLKTQQAVERKTREENDRSRLAQEDRESDALRLAMKDHPEVTEASLLAAAAVCLGRLTGELKLERHAGDIYRQHARSLLESAGVTLPAYLDHPDDPASPLARAAQAAAVMQFGHEHDKQAYLRSRGWIMQPVGWRDSGGEAHGFDAAVKLQVRRDLEPMKHLAKPRG